MSRSQGEVRVSLRLLTSPVPLPCTAEGIYFATRITIDPPIDPAHAPTVVDENSGKSVSLKPFVP